MCDARPAKRQDAAARAEIVPRRVSIERILAQPLDRREQPETIRRHAMDQRAAAPADRAVADTDMVDVGIEAHVAAMTRAPAGPLHLPPRGAGAQFYPNSICEQKAKRDW
jgi:hypothetical protein